MPPFSGADMGANPISATKRERGGCRAPFEGVVNAKDKLTARFAEQNFRAAVLGFWNAVRSLDQKIGFASRFGHDRALGNTLTDHLFLHGKCATCG